MYPNDEAPNYGVFVKNTEQILSDAGFTIDTTVIFKQKSKVKKLISYLGYYFRILWKGTMKHYDVTYVHYASHNALPLLLLKKLKKQTVIFTNVHGSDVVPEVASQEKYQASVKELLTQSDTIITPSQYYRDLVRSKYGVQNRIEVFPSGGINSKVFYDNGNKKETQLELGLDPEKKYIGYVSRLDVGKGWDTLLDAFYALKKDGKLDEHVSLLMVGDGKDRKSFDEKVRTLGLNDSLVHFPLLSQEKLNKIYNSIEVFCFPTTRKGESLGLVGLEAMACGAPIIGSAIGGLLDYIVDGENGYLFEPGSSEELAGRLDQFFSLTEEERNQLSEKAKQKAAQYEVQTIKDTLVKIFKGEPAQS